MNILLAEDFKSKAPAVFTTEAPEMSNRYLQIPTYEIIEALRDAGYYPVNVQQARTRKEGGSAYAKHVIRFRSRLDLEARAVVNELIPELVFTNSHNGTSLAELMFGIFRFICGNGLTVADSTIGMIKIRHTGKREMINELIQGAQDITAQSGRVIDLVRTWQGSTLSDSAQFEYAKGAIELYKGSLNKPDLDIAPGRVLYARRYGDNKPDLWNVYNRVQENFIRGGFYTQNKDGRYRHARAIASLDRNLKINKDLWEYTSKFYQN